MHEFGLIDLLRHGEPEGGQRFRGSTDDPLSEAGWAQMQTSVGQHAPWTRLLSSPLQRCRQFAEHLGRVHQLPLALDDALREMHFGDWEGLSAAEVHERFPAELSRFWEQPLEFTPRGAEPLRDFHTRIVGAFETLRQSAPGEHLLLVCHGGVIRVILCEVLGMPVEHLLRIEVPHASLSRLRVQRDGSVSLCFHGLQEGRQGTALPSTN